MQRFYSAFSQLLRNYQFRDRDRQMICGITVTQCYALEFIVDDGPLTILDIGKRLAVNKSNASRVVESLESAGAVARERDPANHRIRWIVATPAGRRLHAAITAGLKREYGRILGRFSPSFLREATRLLEALAESALQRPRFRHDVARR